MNAVRSMLVSCALACGASAEARADVAVRFHPSGHVWTHELEAARGLSTVLIPNTAVVNEGGEPVTVEALRFDLMQGGEVVATQHVGAAELDAMATRGEALAQSGMLALLDFQFSAKTLLGAGVELAGARKLDARRALYVSTRLFAFAGQPDAVRVTVALAGDAPDAVRTLEIRHGTAPGTFRFPLRGRWFVAAGATPHNHHRWVVPEEFALDIVKLGPDGRTHRGDGARMRDYFAYGAPVLAVAPGKVVALQEDQPDHVEMMRRKDEALADYQKRVLEMQDVTLAKGAEALAGNFVVVEHAGGVHSVYGHLAPDSVPVAVGDHVEAGTRIGALGGSGNSTEPHLHFHLCDAPSALACAGMPIHFDGIELPFTDYPRQVQSGDVVEAR